MALDRRARWRVVERRALGEDTLLVLDRALMFTGIVTAVGTVRARGATTGGLELAIDAP